jgi:hypothetical protein
MKAWQDEITLRKACLEMHIGRESEKGYFSAVVRG